MSAAITTLAQLNTHMLTRSYIAGYSMSPEDATVFSKLGAAALSGSSSAPQAYRWALHISALQGRVIKPTAPPAKSAAASSDDFDVDNMFAAEPSATEELNEDGENAEEAAATAARRERMAKAAALKAEADAKKGVKKSEKAVEKSLVVLEVKPWEADTDLEMVWKEIKKFEKEGLVWGESFKLEPVAYGIKKLVMTCAIVDSMIVMDDITEAIEALEEWVQSVQVASMNKI